MNVMFITVLTQDTALSDTVHPNQQLEMFSLCISAGLYPLIKMFCTKAEMGRCWKTCLAMNSNHVLGTVFQNYLWAPFSVKC